MELNIEWKSPEKPARVRTKSLFELFVLFFVPLCAIDHLFGEGSLYVYLIKDPVISLGWAYFARWGVRQFRLNQIRATCPFCDGKKECLADYQLPRNELITKRRIEKGLSADELGVKVGFYTKVIHDIEKDPDCLKKWVLDDVGKLSDALEIPIQVLLGIKCERCGHQPVSRAGAYFFRT